MKNYILTTIICIYTFISSYAESNNKLAPETLFRNETSNFLKDLTPTEDNRKIIAELLNNKLTIPFFEPIDKTADPKENVIQQLQKEQHKDLRYGLFDGHEIDIMITEAQKLRKIVVEQLTDNWTKFKALLKDKYGHSFELNQINDIVLSYHSSGSQKDVWRISFEFEDKTVSLALAALKTAKILHEENGKVLSYGEISSWEQNRMQILYDSDQIVPLYGWEGNLMDGRNYFFSEFIEGDILYDVPDSSFTEKMALDTVSVWAKMIAKLYQKREQIIDMELGLKKQEILKTDKNISDKELIQKLEDYKKEINVLLMPSDINGENVMFELDHQQTKLTGKKVYGRARIIDTGNKEVRGMKYQQSFDIFKMYYSLTGYSNAVEKLQLAKSLSQQQVDTLKHRCFFAIIAQLSSSIPFIADKDEISIFSMLDSLDLTNSLISEDYNFLKALSNFKSLIPVLSGQQSRDIQFFQYFSDYLGSDLASAFFNNFSASLKGDLLVNLFADKESYLRENLEFTIKSIEKVLSDIEAEVVQKTFEYAA